MKEHGFMKGTSLGKLFTEVWQLFQLLVVYALVYSFLIDVVNKAYLLFSGRTREVYLSHFSESNAVANPIIDIGIGIEIAGLPDWLVNGVLGVLICIVVGYITYKILKEVCEEKWVQEPVQIKECWEEVQWWNPWSWVVAIVCTVKEVLKWVLKIICSILEILIIIAVILCIVLVIAAVIATL